VNAVASNTASATGYASKLVRVDLETSKIDLF